MFRMKTIACHALIFLQFGKQITFKAVIKTPDPIRRKAETKQKLPGISEQYFLLISCNTGGQ